MPGCEAPAPYETPFFGMVTVQSIAPHFFNDQITEYDQMTPEEKVHFAKSIRRREREVTLSSHIQHHPHIMKLIAFLSFAKKDKDDTYNINRIVFEYAPQGTVTDYGKMIKLGNFGYAKKDQSFDNSCRRDENIIYCTPEAFGKSDFGKYSFSADFWSFGSFLYFVTTVIPTVRRPVPSTSVFKWNGGLDHLSES